MVRPGGRRAAGLMAKAAVCVAATLLLLNREIVPLEGVPESGPGSDYGLLTWNFWWLTESLESARNPYRTNLLYHPLGSLLTSHTLGPGFAPVGLVTEPWAAPPITRSALSACRSGSASHWAWASRGRPSGPSARAP